MAAERLFFALWPNAHQRAALAAAAQEVRKAHPDGGGRRVASSRLHATLLFLGLLDAAQAEAARTAASSVRGAPFDLVLDRAGGFPRARVWWLGCAARPSALMALWLELSAAMDAAAVVYDRRPLAPHVTFQRGVLRLLPVHDRPPVVWPVREFTLVRSALRPAPSAYEVVARWPLGSN